MYEHGLLLASIFLAALPVSGDDKDKTQPLAGWYGVFTDLTNYGRRFEAPHIDPERKTTAYRQTAVYEWLGGRLETLSITLARDPNFKTQHTAEAIRKLDKEAKAVQVRGKDGWLITSNHLVLVLGEDKALIVKRQGDGPDLTEVAKQFDPAKMEKALAAPPRTDTKRKLEHFKGLQRGSSYADLQAWVGNPDEDIGSGIHVLVYALPDGSRVLVGTADFRQLNYVRHEQKNGKVEILTK